MPNGKTDIETKTDVSRWPTVIYCQGCMQIRGKHPKNDVLCSSCLREMAEGWPEDEVTVVTENVGS